MFCRILLVPHNIVMALNNVMDLTKVILKHKCQARLDGFVTWLTIGKEMGLRVHIQHTLDFTHSTVGLKE
jgi:hypothetical protein